MSDDAQYDAAAQKSIRDEYARAGAAHCPEDGSLMTLRRIGGGSFGLGYARRREWLLCPTCKKSLIFDRQRGTRT